jgi:hypothetical protein
MKIFTLRNAFLFIFCLSLQWTWGQITESFDYTVGGTLNGKGTRTAGWAGAWAMTGGMDVAKIEAGSLIPLLVNVPGSAGGKLNFDKANVTTSTVYSYLREFDKPFTDDGKQLWFSYLYDVKKDNYSLNNNGGFDLMSGTADQLYVGRMFNLNTFGLFTGGTNIFSTVSSTDTVNWVVVGIFMSGNTGREKVYLFINPAPNAMPDTAKAVAKATIPNIPAAGLTALRLKIGGVSNKASFDEIRFRPTFAGLLSSTKESAFSQVMSVDAYPNPFIHETALDFTLVKPSRITLSVYDATGRLIDQKNQGDRPVGTQRIVWNSPKDLHSGLYLLTLSDGNNAVVTKTVMKQ